MNLLRYRHRPVGTFLVFAAAITIGLAVGCEYTNSSGGPGRFQARQAPDGGPLGNSTLAGEATRSQFLTAVGSCTAARTAEFEVRAAALAAATEVFATTPDEPNRQAATAAWLAASDVWQELEVFRFGPAAAPDKPAGKDLREYVSSWPLVSRCLVEQTLVSRAYEDSAFLQKNLVNAQGLIAAEYLLFYTGADNACGAASAINSTGTWAALDPRERMTRQASYSRVVAGGVSLRAQELAAAWDPARGNFGAELVGRGVYSSEQAALNAVSDGLFYVERYVKDLKLGKPLGLYEPCGQAICPESVESKYAQASTRHIKNNLVGFKRLVVGCNDDFGGTGLDDVLTGLGADDLAMRLTALVNETLTTIEPWVSTPLERLLTDNLPVVTQLHSITKRVTDLLKTEVVTVLDVEPPKEIQGDND